MPSLHCTPMHHRLPTYVWLHVGRFLQPRTIETSGGGRDWLVDCVHALCMWRQLDTAWRAWVRDLVRPRLPVTVAPHPLWPLACHPPSSPLLLRCAACGTHTVLLTPRTIHWHVVVYGFGTGVHTWVNRTQCTRVCARCTQRCTLSGKQAMRTLLHAAVGEYQPSSTRGSQREVEPMLWVAAEGYAQSVVVLLDDHHRYLRADVDAMAARPGWGSHSIERIDFTSHRVALEWRVSSRVIQKVNHGS